MARATQLVDKLQIIAPDPKKHYDLILDLTGKAFARHRYWTWLDYCNNGYIAESFYDWKASRIGLLDGKLVTHFGIWDHWMRIGSATVRVAGVGAVATDGTYYKQGLMARTASDCVDSLGGHGYHMTMLHGIPDFYHRFGYVRAWPDTEFTAELSAIAGITATHRLPALKLVKDEWPELDALHNRQNKGLTGTTVRPTYRRNRKPEDWKVWLWRGAGRRLEGYVVVSCAEDALEVIDQAGDPDLVLAAAARLARDNGHRRLRFPALHYRSELGRHLRCCDCRYEQRVRATGGWMVRTVSLAATLERTRAELGRRLLAAGLKGWRGELLIQDPRERVVLGIKDARVEVRAASGRAPVHAVRGNDAIARLLIGSDTPDEVAAAAGMRLSGDAPILVRTLFAEQQPAIPRWDYY